MNAAGLIFSNIHDQSIPQLTNNRTMASVPFGCRYRLIDFALSNMVNSDITKIGIITHNNYQSLLDHIGTGKDWDLARRSGGIKILPPYITSFENSAANKFNTSRLCQNLRMSKSKATAALPLIPPPNRRGFFFALFPCKKVAHFKVL